MSRKSLLLAFTVSLLILALSALSYAQGFGAGRDGDRDEDRGDYRDRDFKRPSPGRGEGSGNRGKTGMSVAKDPNAKDTPAAGSMKAPNNGRNVIKRDILGRLVDSNGRLVDAYGNPLDAFGKSTTPVPPRRRGDGYYYYGGAYGNGRRHYRRSDSSYWPWISRRFSFGLYGVYLNWMDRKNSVYLAPGILSVFEYVNNNISIRISSHTNPSPRDVEKETLSLLEEYVNGNVSDIALDGDRYLVVFSNPSLSGDSPVTFTDTPVLDSWVETHLGTMSEGGDPASRSSSTSVSSSSETTEGSSVRNEKRVTVWLPPSSEDPELNREPPQKSSVYSNLGRADRYSQ